MFDFGNCLWQDEEILYEGKSVAKAANKQIFIILGIEAVLIAMFIFFVKNFSEMADQTGVVGIFLIPNEKAVIVFESIANQMELWSLAKKAFSEVN